MKKILIIFMISIQIFWLQAQEMTISGFVMDEAGIPIDNVNIFCEKTKQGTVSDEAGGFSLKLLEQPTTLTFSHIAFLPKQISITQETIAQGKRMGEIELGVVLQARSEMLSAVEIVDGKVMIAYSDPKKWILDYEFIGKDEVLLLLTERNKRYLQLIDNNDKIVAKKQVNGKYSGFYKDCFGNIFLKSDEDVCQIFLQTNNEFLLAHQIPMEIFLSTIEKVVAETQNYLYLKEVSIRDQDIVYYRLDTLSKEFAVLHHINDDTGEKLQAHQQDLTKAQGEYDEMIVREMEMAISRMFLNASPSGGSIGSNSMAVHRAYMTIWNDQYKRSNRSTENYKTFYDYFLSQSPYSPLFKINNTLYIFNHIDDEIIAFDTDGNFIKESEIDYHKNPNWGKELIVDEEKSLVFVKFSKDGFTTLRQIDPNTGTFTGHDIVLEKHAYPKNIKIRGDYIYYLARAYFQDENKYFLWKQHLE